MKDAAQKDLLYRHFRAMGWYALVEVPVYHRGGTSAREKLITDVDVLALRATPDLRWEAVIGDCKTRKSESPANRVLWARALMDQFRAVRGYVLLKRDRGQPIEPDHKLYAHSLGVTLLEESEFPAYDRAVLYPSGSSRVAETSASLLQVYDVASRYPPLASLVGYLRGSAWSEQDHFTMLRRVIAFGRDARKEIDPSNPDHLALFIEAAAVFAVAVATCVGTVFHQHLQPESKDVLDDALRCILWGGRERYESVSAMRQQLRAAKGAEDDDDGLGLPRWPAFLQLVRSGLECPRLVFRLPGLLRGGAVDMSVRRPFLERTSRDTMLLKLALLTTIYYAQACLLPAEASTRLRDLFVGRISDAARGGAETPRAADPAIAASRREPNEVGDSPPAAGPHAPDDAAGDAIQPALPGLAESRDR